MGGLKLRASNFPNAPLNLTHTLKGYINIKIHLHMKCAITQLLTLTHARYFHNAPKLLPLPQSNPHCWTFLVQEVLSSSTETRVMRYQNNRKDKLKINLSNNPTRKLICSMTIKKIINLHFYSARICNESTKKEEKLQGRFTTQK